MSEIATAYVRVRANTTGFRSETEASAKSAALGAAKVFAGAFAAVKIFDFAKSVVSEAAQTQKATENIRAQFAGSSDAVLQFGGDAAKSFGISRLASETFSSSIGLVGKNLGIGSAKTAEMDIGLQKLAGSIGLIKGIDPASVFDKLQLALLGNTRGLKTLGISVDTTREKQALLDAGVIKATVDEVSVTKARLAAAAATKAASDAITKYGQGSSEAAKAVNDAQQKQQALQKALAGTVPTITAAQKAQAIYLLATKQLPGFLDQAAKHSGDLADEQRKLSAEWQNAKEEIGSALLPEVTSLAGGLLGLLHAAEQNKGTIRAAFGDVGAVLAPVGASVRFLADNLGTVGPIVEGLVVSFTAFKAVTIATGIAQAAYSAIVATVNTAQLLLAGGTSAVATAQAIQTGSMGAATIAAGAEAATLEALSLATAGFAAITTGAVAPTAALALASAGLSAAEDAMAVSAASAAAGVGVLDAAILASPIGLLTIAIAGGAGLIFALSRLGSSTSALEGDFQSAASAVGTLRDALRSEKDAVNALISDDINLRQSHLDVTRTTASLAAANADVAAKQRVVNELQRSGQTDTQAYRDATAALTASKQADTQAAIDHDRAIAGEGQTYQQLTKDLGAQKKASEESTASVQNLTGSFNRLTHEAESTQATLGRARGETFAGGMAAKQAARNVAEFAQKTQDLSAATTASIPKLQATADKANTLADGFGNSRSKAALAAKEYAANATAAVNAAKRLAILESTASLLASAWGRIVDLPTAAFFIKETTQLTSIETNRLNRQGGGPIPAGVLSLTGEQGPELSISSAGRQIISSSDTAGLFRELGSGLAAVARALEDQAAKTSPTQQPAFAFNAPVTIETPDPKDFLKRLAALVPR